MEELEFELGVEVGLQKLSSCFTATISIAGASYCIFIAKIINYVIRGAKLKKYFLKPQQELVFWNNVNNYLTLTFEVCCTSN